MNKMRLLIIFILFGALFSCENTAEETRKFSAYFDADSLITAQLEMIEDWNVQVKKVAMLDGKEDTATYTADSARLYQELNVFRKANINKPAYDDLYQKNIESHNDFKIVRYNPVERENDLEVKSLELKYKEDQLLQLEAVIVEDHWLYNSKRTLRLEFSGEPSYISSYYLEGTQKMILRDRVNFIVEGDIMPEFTSSIN